MFHSDMSQILQYLNIVSLPQYLNDLFYYSEPQTSYSS